MLRISKGLRFFTDERQNLLYRFGKMIQAADNADNVAVNNGFGQVKSEGKKAGCGIGTDPFEFEHIFAGLRKAAAEIFDDRLRRGMQGTCPRIVAQSLPIAVNFFQIGRG